MATSPIHEAILLTKLPATVTRLIRGSTKWLRESLRLEEDQPPTGTRPARTMAT